MPVQMARFKATMDPARQQEHSVLDCCKKSKHEHFCLEYIGGMSDSNAPSDTFYTQYLHDSSHAGLARTRVYQINCNARRRSRFLRWPAYWLPWYCPLWRGVS